MQTKIALSAMAALIVVGTLAGYYVGKAQKPNCEPLRSAASTYLRSTLDPNITVLAGRLPDNYNSQVRDAMDACQA